MLSAFPVFARSLPYVRRGYYIHNTTQLRKLRCAVFVSVAPCLLGGCSLAQPSTSIGTLSLTFIDCSAIASLFRLPLHARIPTALKKGFSVCGGCSIAATPPHRSSKKSSVNYAFFLRCLGVFKNEPYTNALRLFAHFFRRLPGRFFFN